MSDLDIVIDSWYDDNQWVSKSGTNIQAQFYSKQTFTSNDGTNSISLRAGGNAASDGSSDFSSNKPSIDSFDGWGTWTTVSFWDRSGA